MYVTWNNFPHQDGTLLLVIIDHGAAGGGWRPPRGWANRWFTSAQCQLLYILPLQYYKLQGCMQKVPSYLSLENKMTGLHFVSRNTFWELKPSLHTCFTKQVWTWYLNDCSYKCCYAWTSEKREASSGLPWMHALTSLRKKNKIRRQSATKIKMEDKRAAIRP